MLLLGFASGLRRSELVALNLADVRQESAGLALHVRRSKTDQEGAGAWVAVHRGRRRATCPVRALQACLGARGAWAGPLFARISKAGDVEATRLSGDAIAAIVQAAARPAGLDASKYGGHSLRG